MRARLLPALILVGSLMLVPLVNQKALAAPEYQQADPGARGSLAVTRTSYDFGDAVFRPTNWPVAIEFRAQVHHPTDLSNGPYPLILMLHGRHATCFNGVGQIQQVWPCPAGFQPIPSHQGFDYVADVLASQGFIVASISANGISAFDDTSGQPGGPDRDGGANARAQLVLAHLELWSRLNTTPTGLFGSRFAGKVNLNAVGLMGQSRGGEGIVRAVQINAENGTRFGIRSAFLLAPVDFNRYVINNIPLAVLLPYCDGDAADLQGLKYYDDSRYNSAGDTAPKHTILVMGANHNFYNTVWTPGPIPGGLDDWQFIEALPIFIGQTDPHCSPNRPGNGRLSPDAQRSTGISFLATFFRVYLRGESAFAPILQTGAALPPSAAGAAVRMSYHAPSTTGTRRDINRFLSQAHLTTNDLGGTVTVSNLVEYGVCGGDPPLLPHCLSTTDDDREPHTVTSRFSTRGGLSQLGVQWSDTGAMYRNAIPAASGDVSGFARLQFRLSTIAGGGNASGVSQNFSIVLTDSSNRVSAAVRAGDYSPALYYPPGGLVPQQPRHVLNTVGVPLSAFSGVDLRNIRSVEFRFNQSTTGALLITDLAFANPSVVLTAVGPAGVSVRRETGPSLRSTLTARPGCGRIDLIQFGNLGAPLNNAIVTVVAPSNGPSNQTVGFNYAPPDGTTSVQISISRQTASGGATVSPILLYDGCGVWRTFVGGGASAFR